MCVFFPWLPMVFNNESLYFKASIFLYLFEGFGNTHGSKILYCNFLLTLSSLFIYHPIAMVMISNVFCNWNTTTFIYKICFYKKKKWESFSLRVSMLSIMIHSDTNCGSDKCTNFIMQFFKRLQTWDANSLLIAIVTNTGFAIAPEKQLHKCKYVVRRHIWLWKIIKLYNIFLKFLLYNTYSFILFILISLNMFYWGKNPASFLLRK